MCNAATACLRLWAQAQVPVAVDLVAVHFPDAQRGWAVGHGGVILHTEDGGLSWRKQMDGRQLATLLIDHWRPLAADGEENPAAAFALMDAERFQEEGPGRPFLDVYFTDARTGYVAGAYNLLLRTQDGGDSWQVLSDRTDNPGGLHLNAVRVARDGRVYLAAEQGLLLQSPDPQGRFESIPTPYAGTWFGMVESEELILLFGLRGNAYVSGDRGVSWRKVDTGTDSTITAGTLMPDDRVVLVTLDGALLISDDPRSEPFTSLVPDTRMALYGVAPADGASVLVVGARGVSKVDLASGALRKPH